jgi:cation diffusion facilitator family transporter
VLADGGGGAVNHHHHHHDLGSAQGIRALKISAAGLGLTAVVQFAVVAVGGSVALFADALHNLGDVFTTVALWIAFVATRRAANERYTFGYQRFEDLAGLVIVAAIFASAGWALYEGVTHLVRAQVPTHIPAGIAAAAVGVVGNEAVAQVKIRTGRRIGSPALVAEGQHSRVDGLASAAAVIGLGGVALGAGWADPVAGIVLGLVICRVGYTSAKPVLARVLDRIDPALIERIARLAIGVEEVQGVHDIRARYAGRALYVLLHVSLPEDMRLEEAHAAGERVRHEIVHHLPEVVQVDVHLDPAGDSEATAHDRTSHHFD